MQTNFSKSFLRFPGILIHSPKLVWRPKLLISSKFGTYKRVDTGKKVRYFFSKCTSQYIMLSNSRSQSTIPHSALHVLGIVEEKPIVGMTARALSELLSDALMLYSVKEFRLEKYVQQMLSQLIHKAFFLELTS